MVAPQPSHGHSARVRLQLLIGKHCIPLAQIGGDRMFFDHSVTLPGVSGEVVAEIDEHQQRWQVTWQASNEPQRVVVVEFREAT